MSLYNLTQGVNQYAKIALGLLHVPESITEPIDFGRVRDAFFELENGVHRIRVHTRNGGPNREACLDVIENLRSHPWFFSDNDCDHDITYADFVFTIPDDQVLKLNEAAPLEHRQRMWQPPVDHAQRFQHSLNAIKKS